MKEYSRFAYVGQLSISTFGNYFPNKVPTAEALFLEIARVEKAKPTKTMKDRAEIFIQDIDVSNGFASLLFATKNPDILDPILFDELSGKTRQNKRKNGEVPIVSVHMVVNTNKIHDHAKIYPSVIENNDFLARSYIIEHLNIVMSEKLKKPMNWTSSRQKVEIKNWIPRINFGAAKKATVDSLLSSNGRLRGVKWVEHSVQDSTIGDGTYAVKKHADVFFSVENKPSGNAAKEILKKLTKAIPVKNTKKISILLEDEHGKQKSVAMESNSTDVLAAIFIPQVQINIPHGAPPIQLFAKSLHKDFVAKLKGAAS